LRAVNLNGQTHCYRAHKYRLRLPQIIESHLAAVSDALPLETPSFQCFWLRLNSRCTQR
jgi:hypothetical protein